MIRYKAVISKFEKKGEKSGWSYILIDQRHASKLNGDVRTSFRVKGKLDDFDIAQTAVLPMGDGSFILPFNAKMRKGTGKKAGDVLYVQIALDDRPPELSKDLIVSVCEDAVALEFFNSLPRSHQQYFSNWIDSARTVDTRTKRITMAVIALASRQGFGEMIRANKGRGRDHKGF